MRYSIKFNKTYKFDVTVREQFHELVFERKISWDELYKNINLFHSLLEDATKLGMKSRRVPGRHIDSD